MGTNYFLTMPNGKMYHIGKKSSGIKFIFNCSQIPIEDWFKYIREAIAIYDEYNHEISRIDLLNIIRSPGKPPEGTYSDDKGLYYYLKHDFFWYALFIEISYKRYLL